MQSVEYLMNLPNQNENRNENWNENGNVNVNANENESVAENLLNLQAIPDQLFDSDFVFC